MFSASACGITPARNSSTVIVPATTGRLVAVAPQEVCDNPGQASRGVVARKARHARDRPTEVRVPAIRELTRLEELPQRSVEGCQTVMCASGPSAGMASSGIGTASKACCNPSFHVPGSSCTRTVGCPARPRRAATSRHARSTDPTPPQHSRHRVTQRPDQHVAGRIKGCRPPTAHSTHCPAQTTGPRWGSASDLDLARVSWSASDLDLARVSWSASDLDLARVSWPVSGWGLSSELGSRADLRLASAWRSRPASGQGSARFLPQGDHRRRTGRFATGSAAR